MHRHSTCFNLSRSPTLPLSIPAVDTHTCLQRSSRPTFDRPSYAINLQTCPPGIPSRLSCTTHPSQPLPLALLSAHPMPPARGPNSDFYRFEEGILSCGSNPFSSAPALKNNLPHGCGECTPLADCGNVRVHKLSRCRRIYWTQPGSLRMRSSSGQTCCSTCACSCKRSACCNRHVSRSAVGKAACFSSFRPRLAPSALSNPSSAWSTRFIDVPVSMSTQEVSADLLRYYHRIYLQDIPRG